MTMWISNGAIKTRPFTGCAFIVSLFFSVFLLSACSETLNDGLPGTASERRAEAEHFGEHYPNPHLFATFTVDGDEFTFDQGQAERVYGTGATQRSSAHILDEYTLTGDFAQDGRLGIAVIIKTQAGGSGSYYYLGVIYKADEKKAADRQYSQTFFLGDRIKVSNISYGRVAKDILAVNVFGRSPGAPYSSLPDIPVQKCFTTRINDDLIAGLSEVDCITGH